MDAKSFSDRMVQAFPNFKVRSTVAYNSEDEKEVLSAIWSLEFQLQRPLPLDDDFMDKLVGEVAENLIVMGQNAMPIELNTDELVEDA